MDGPVDRSNECLHSLVVPTYLFVTRIGEHSAKFYGSASDSRVFSEVEGETSPFSHRRTGSVKRGLHSVSAGMIAGRQLELYFPFEKVDVLRNTDWVKYSVA